MYIHFSFHEHKKHSQNCPDVFFVTRHVGFGIHFEEATNAFVTFMTCAIHATLLIVKSSKMWKKCRWSSWETIQRWDFGPLVIAVTLMIFTTLVIWILRSRWITDAGAEGSSGAEWLHGHLRRYGDVYVNQWWGACNKAIWVRSNSFPFFWFFDLLNHREE